MRSEVCSQTQPRCWEHRSLWLNLASANESSLHFPWIMNDSFSSFNSRSKPCFLSSNFCGVRACNVIGMKRNYTVVCWKASRRACSCGLVLLYTFFVKVIPSPSVASPPSPPLCLLLLFGLFFFFFWSSTLFSCHPSLPSFTTLFLSSTSSLSALSMLLQSASQSNKQALNYNKTRGVLLSNESVMKCLCCSVCTHVYKFKDRKHHIFVSALVDKN